MRDAISIPRAALLHPKVRAEVVSIIDGIEANWPANVKIRIVQGLRTIEEQDALYAQGRTKPGKRVTNAKGGQSYHNFALAFDFVIMVGNKIHWDHPLNIVVVNAFKAAGWKWGGDFKSIVDKPHFEKSFGYTVSQLLAKYKKGSYVSI